MVCAALLSLFDESQSFLVTPSQVVTLGAAATSGSVVRGDRDRHRPILSTI